MGHKYEISQNMRTNHIAYSNIELQYLKSLCLEFGGFDNTIRNLYCCKSLSSMSLVMNLAQLVEICVFKLLEICFKAGWIWHC